MNFPDIASRTEDAIAVVCTLLSTFAMKLLTLNFLTCARKSCKSASAAFPLHPQEAELERIEVDINPPFISNILPRLEWEAMKTVSQEVSKGVNSLDVPYTDQLRSWAYQICRTRCPSPKPSSTSKAHPLRP